MVRNERGREGSAAARLAAGLAYARIGIGTSVWALPRGSMRILGFDPNNPQVMALARLAGTRDLALGAAAAATLEDAESAATMLRANAAVDGLDSVAFAIALARRRGINRAAAIGTLTAAGASVMGFVLARRLASGAESKSL